MSKLNRRRWATVRKTPDLYVAALLLTGAVTYSACDKTSPGDSDASSDPSKSQDEGDKSDEDDDENDASSSSDESDTSNSSKDSEDKEDEETSSTQSDSSESSDDDSSSEESDDEEDDSSSDESDDSTSSDDDTSSNPFELYDKLMELTQAGCERVGGDFATDAGAGDSVPICALKGALHWEADMDIDCDGRPTDVCNDETDVSFYPSTSMGDHLAASELPWVVIPNSENNSRMNFEAHGVQLGSVVAVVYSGKVRFGAFVDSGPQDIIGEVSYAMAELFGVNPDPSNGGTDNKVTYIVFTDEAAVVSADEIEDHGLAEEIGADFVEKLLDEN